MGDPRTLRELFLSERWRGRDNLRVSLRSLKRPSDLPSVLIPIIDAVALVAASIGFVLAAAVGRAALMVAGGSLALIVLGALLRTMRMIVGSRLQRPLDWARAALVALFYDLGRACSLVWPARHRRVGPDPSAFWSFEVSAARAAAPRKPSCMARGRPIHHGLR
jgi:hypothetical protein